MGNSEIERGTEGFTLVEVIIATLLLAMGIVALGWVSGYVATQLNLANVTSERATALQVGLEQVRALNYDSVSAGADTIGRFTVTWTVTTDGRSKIISMITSGPGLSGGRLIPVVPDTFIYRVLDAP